MDQKIRKLEKRLIELETQLQQEARQRQAAEEDLHQSQQTLKAILREMPVIILAIDDDGCLVFFNNEFERVSGYSASEINDDPQLLELLIPENAHGFLSETEGQTEWNFLSSDGVEKTIAWSNLSGYLPIFGWKSWKVGLDITELKQTMAKVKTLGGLLPICANCKKIRDDTGYWNRLEAYIQTHSQAEFTHGICPECVVELYPEFQE
jgi:PAS domain-containing protein